MEQPCQRCSVSAFSSRRGHAHSSRQPFCNSSHMSQIPIAVSQLYSIVVIGSLNPAILHPAWFRHFDLLPQTETDNAIIEVVSPDVSVIQASWLRIEATQQRLLASTGQNSHTDALRDLVAGVLALLSHTPVTAVGLNLNASFSVPGEELWHKIGHALSPKNIWQGLMNLPGTKSVAIEDPRMDKDLPGNFHVNISSGGRQVVSVATNDHYEIKQGGALAAAALIRDRWQDSIDRANVLGPEILERAMKYEPNEFESYVTGKVLDISRRADK